ncbi:NAD(P)/FAD-dependent oxidoreductase [Acidobacteriota bacterium]
MMEKRSSECKRDRRVVIVGGGPAGLTASYQLSKAGFNSIVLEKDHALGGLSRTVNYKDYYFDIGGHRFFTKIQDVEDLWKEILAEDLLRRKRFSRIYYNNRFFNYPLRIFNALLGLGIFNSIMIVTSYLRIKLAPLKMEDNFEQWVTNRFGRRLFRIFFKTYTEKVWGIPCTEIRAEWAAQRIKGLSLISALKNALVGSQNNKNVIKTLIDEFYYPRLGPGMMWTTASEIIKNNGSEVRLGAEVQGIRWSEGRVDALEVKQNGRTELVQGTDFISSMPLREAIQKMKPDVPEEVLIAAKDLKYRDFLTVSLIIKEPDLFPDNWIYIHDPNVKVGRIQNFKNWSPYMVPDQDKTCLGLEYFCFEGDTLWSMSDAALIELGTRELESLGFVRAEDVEDGMVVRMPKAYPIYDSSCHESVAVVRRFLEGLANFQPIGRNGQHKYNNQDHSMLTAMKAAENVLGSNHDLWDVNEEQEYLEEIKLRPDEKTAWRNLLERTFSQLDKLGFATAIGTAFGLAVFLVTILLVIKGGQTVGPTLQLLNQYFFGYSVTVKGAFIGFAYSFFWGFLFGWLFAYLRNLFVGFFIYTVKKRLELLKFKDFFDNF